MKIGQFGDHKLYEIRELKTFEHLFFNCNWVFETWLSFKNFHWQARLPIKLLN